MMSEDVPLERDENGAVLTYIVHMKYFRDEGKRMADVRAWMTDVRAPKRNKKGQFTSQN